MIETYKTELIQTGIVLLALLLIRFITRHSINRALKKFNFSLQRRRITIKILNFFLLIGAVVAVVAIWGIEQQRLFLFLSSVLTIIGVAFFAQWSLLANITAGFILYFNHPMKIGDRIKILEKDNNIEGVVDDITFFFLHLKTDDKEHVTIPNSILLQKNISTKSSTGEPVKSIKRKR
ncbi:MAG: mechanosensitive ion channel family protein [Prolixibacteraceae bacterium]|nr:mechanosensitive ion channel family protein [Prolixibacteraceae bacterium]MBN2648121.1 mechanosensitive ion channel family protein [Prolixibacteraceae bacterium]